MGREYPYHQGFGNGDAHITVTAAHALIFSGTFHLRTILTV